MAVVEILATTKTRSENVAVTDFLSRVSVRLFGVTILAPKSVEVSRLVYVPYALAEVPMTSNEKTRYRSGTYKDQTSELPGELSNVDRLLVTIDLIRGSASCILTDSRCFRLLPISVSDDTLQPPAISLNLAASNINDFVRWRIEPRLRKRAERIDPESLVEFYRPMWELQVSHGSSLRRRLIAADEYETFAGPSSLLRMA